MCACVGGFATAPPIRHGPEGPSRIRCIYIYIHTYILYTSYIVAAVGYPIPNVPLCPPPSALSQTPIPSPLSVHQCRQSSTGSGSTTIGIGGGGGGGVTNPPPSPITVSSLSSAALYCCRRQRPTSPPTIFKILLYPLVFQRNPGSSSSSNRISPAVQTHLGPTIPPI